MVHVAYDLRLAAMLYSDAGEQRQPACRRGGRGRRSLVSLRPRPREAAAVGHSTASRTLLQQSDTETAVGPPVRTDIQDWHPDRPHADVWGARTATAVASPPWPRRWTH
jgi:hypothetical protein